MKNNKLYERYTVQKGDTLWGIARAHHTHWRKLAKLNKIDNPHLIYVGQEILIPPIILKNKFSIGKVMAGLCNKEENYED